MSPNQSYSMVKLTGDKTQLHKYLRIKFLLIFTLQWECTTKNQQIFEKSQETKHNNKGGRGQVR